MKIEEIYDADFFFMHTGWQLDYRIFAFLLRFHFCFYSLIDFGCGNGYIAAELKRAGKQVIAFDGAHTATGYSNISIAQYDLTQPIELPFQVDISLCLEVAEHLPEESSDVLVKTLTDASNEWIVFSAATPGFGGHHHLNEQPRKYWMDKFESRGFYQDRTKSFKLRWDLRNCCEHTWWFGKNVMVLRKMRSSNG
jgi:SAM-dependent methyltransferase